MIFLCVEKLIIVTVHVKSSAVIGLDHWKVFVHAGRLSVLIVKFMLTYYRSVLAVINESMLSVVTVYR